MNENRNRLFVIFLLLILFFLFGFFLHAFLNPSIPSGTVIASVFSPSAEPIFSDLLSKAKHSIDIEVYTFSSDSILNELVSAKNAGVKIRVILEKRVISKTNQETFDKLSNAGIEIKWASKEFKLTHAKFIIIDGEMVLVGSHNLSENALNSNREASVVINGPVVKEFINIFEQDWSLNQKLI